MPWARNSARPGPRGSSARRCASSSRFRKAGELQFLIAQDLQAALPELVYVTRIIQEQATRPAPRDEIRKRIHEVSGMTLAKYRETIALPLWKVQAGEPHSDLDSSIKRGSMAPIVDRLGDDARVHVLDDADDFMAEERSIRALEAAWAIR